MNLGENIKRFRKVRKLTQSELSTETGIPRSTIQKYESGSIQNVSITTVELLGEALQVQPNDLVGWHCANPETEELIAKYQSLGSEDQSLVYQLIERLNPGD